MPKGDPRPRRRLAAVPQRLGEVREVVPAADLEELPRCEHRVVGQQWAHERGAPIVEVPGCCVPREGAPSITRRVYDPGTLVPGDQVRACGHGRLISDAIKKCIRHPPRLLPGDPPRLRNIREIAAHTRAGGGVEAGRRDDPLRVVRPVSVVLFCPRVHLRLGQRRGAVGSAWQQRAYSRLTNGTQRVHLQVLTKTCH